MALSIDDLNGFEMIELKNRVGGRLETADGIDVSYSLFYIFKRREVEGYTYDDALATKWGDVQTFLGLDDDDEVAMPFEVEDNDPKD